MLPSRGAKRITLQLDKPDNTRGWKIPQVDRSRINDQTITRDPQRVQTPQLTRPFDESGDTPLSQPSMWQASADLGGDDHKREAVKSQLESITGRMFALLNDYEDDGLPSTNKSYIEDLSKQVNEIENTALRDNIHLMLQDYNDMCAERDELLYSLQDWFEEGHIDDMIQDIPDSGGESLSIKQSLMESKAVSERLKVVNRELHEKHTGDDSSVLLQEKMELEKELLKSKKVYDSLKNNQDGPSQKGQNQEVAHSWKFAAQDIFSVLTKVRNDGLLDVQELEDQITKLVSAMNEQARYIDTVKDELGRQREMNTMCSNIQAFLDYSTNLINREAVIVAEATDSLQTKLREAEQTAATPDPPSSQLQSDSEKTSEKNDMGSSYNTPSVAPGNKMAAYEDLKLQVQSIGQQAIDTLKTSEQLFSQNISKQRNQLTKVAMAMAEHKKRQSPSWKFSLSNEEGFVLNATALHKPVGVVSDNPDKRTVNPYIGLSLKQRMRHLIGGNVYGTNWHRDVHGLGSGGLLGLHMGVGSSARFPVLGAENSSSASRRTQGDSIPMLIQGKQPKDRTLYEDHSSAGRAPRARTHPDFSKAAILSNMRQRNRQRHNTGYYKLGGILSRQLNFHTDEPPTAGQDDSNRLPLIAKRKKGQIITDEESSSQRKPAQRLAFLQASGKKAYMDMVSHSNATSGNQTSLQQSGENKLPRIRLGVHKHMRQRTL